MRDFQGSEPGAWVAGEPMLIIMSDLHFAESDSFRLGNIAFDHNLPAEVYHAYFNEIGKFISDGEINRVELILAGDIFEINRTTMWLRDSLRPYLNLKDITPGGEVETRILEILDAIAREKRVEETLAIFRNLSNMLNKPVTVHYMPGNHDRLLNATPALRQRVQNLLGMPENNAPFPNQYIHYVEGEARFLVRHGHEYDSANFGANLKTWTAIPTFIDKDLYAKPVFGDFVTVEVAAKLPYLFKRYYGEETILTVPELTTIYKRLVEFDNVRPAQALLNYLFTTPGMEKKDVWRFIEPVFILALKEMAVDSDYGKTIKQLGMVNGPSAVGLKAVLGMRFWRKGIPFWLFRLLLGPISKSSKVSTPLPEVSKETCLRPGASNIVCVISGHTHNPVVELIQVNGGTDKYYINSGTFRNVIATTADMETFSRLRAKARVLIFDKTELSPEYTDGKEWSFDFQAKYGYGPEA